MDLLNIVTFCLSLTAVALVSEWMHVHQACSTGQMWPRQQSHHHNDTRSSAQGMNNSHPSVSCTLPKPRLFHDPSNPQVPLPIVLVTSVGSRYVRARAMARFQATIWEREPAAPLIVYHENTWEVSHHREPLQKAEFNMSTGNVTMCDVFLCNPWLNFTQSLDPSSPIEQWYQYAGHGEPYETPSLKSGKILLRKLASIHDALHSYPDGTQVVWVDADVVSVMPFDGPWVATTRTYDIVYIPFRAEDRDWRNESNSLLGPWRIESGVMAIMNSPRTRALFEDAVDAYRLGLLLRTRRLCDAPPPSRPEYCALPWLKDNLFANDIFVLTYLLHAAAAGMVLPSNTNATHLPLRQGWFPTGCGKRCKCERTDGKVNYQYPWGNVVCVGETANTMPFHLTEYLDHRVLSGVYSHMRSLDTQGYDAELRFD